jgi:RHS repeat-associated protein
LLVLSTTNAYDTHGRLKGITQRNSTGIIAQSTYVLDNLNRLTATTKNGQTQTYDYDSTDQVQTVTGSNSEAYTYDRNGNRTNSGYITDAGNRLRSDGTYNYEYDSEGNRAMRTKIADGTVDTYRWDYRNRLMGIVSTDLDGVVTRSVGYTYDVDDRRVGKTVDGVVENYYLDGEQIAFVTDGGGNETEHYLYGLNVDQVLAADSATGMLWALADRLGSVDTLTDADGNVVDERTFDSFGNLLSTTANSSLPTPNFRYGYTGRELDLESGLDYYRARYYDASVGRFISVDPMGFGAGDTNLYRYVGNNSTNATDPTGLYSFGDFGRDAWNFGQSIGRNFDYSFDAVNNNVVRPLNNAVFKPVVNAVNTNFIKPYSYAASNAVDYYTDLVAQGQQEDGVGGLIKQGAGYLGGTFASVPGATAQFVQTNGTRIGGAVKAVGGGIQVMVGLGTTATVFGAPIGAPVVANGVDNLQAGLRQLRTGENTNTLLYEATKRITGSDKLAGTVDAATGLVLNTATAKAAAQRAADRALAAEVDAINRAESAAQKAFLKTQCFVAGTEIQTLNGTKNIEDIHVGDWVLSDDPYTVGEIEYKQVLNTFVKQTTNLVDIYIDGEKITTTEEHPFWVPDVGWVAAKDLYAGSLLQTKTESWLDIDKVELHGGLTTVYNFEVAGFHTYFVSDLGLLVHNTCNVSASDLTNAYPPDVELVPLWRAVQTAELKSIQSKNRYTNLSPMFEEHKYFATTAEGAASYAQQAYRAPSFRVQGPFTITQTSIPKEFLRPEMSELVDGNVDAIVLLTSDLPYLNKPTILNSSPITGLRH